MTVVWNAGKVSHFMLCWHIINFGVIDKRCLVLPKIGSHLTFKMGLIPRFLKTTKGPKA